MYKDSLHELFDLEAVVKDEEKKRLFRLINLIIEGVSDLVLSCVCRTKRKNQLWDFLSDYVFEELEEYTLPQSHTEFFSRFHRALLPGGKVAYAGISFVIIVVQNVRYHRRNGLVNQNSFRQLDAAEKVLRELLESQRVALQSPEYDSVTDMLKEELASLRTFR